VLNRCLASDDLLSIDLATQGLWECWLNERGPEARREMDEGVVAMNKGDLKRAETVFAKLMKKYPDWAEAINKQATVLYLQDRPKESLVLCKKVVALKPDHFGAWSGMAMCAMQVKDWTLARKAAHEALRIQPHSIQNQKMLKAIEGQITDV
jgi:Flp pilus assembly protein TadD